MKLHNFKAFYLRSLLLFVCLCSIVSAQDDAAIRQVLRHQDSLWVPEYISAWGWCIEFKDHFQARFVYCGEGDDVVRADYKIVDGTISISKYDSKDTIQETDTCILLKLENDPKYLWKLSCKASGSFWSHSHLSNRRQTSINGTSALTLGAKKAKIIHNANFRTMPDKRASVIKCVFNPKAKPIGHLPVGTSILLLARTKDKYVVEEWKTHWYYVEVYYFYYDGQECDSHRGWVYGQFIKAD